MKEEQRQVTVMSSYTSKSRDYGTKKRRKPLQGLFQRLYDELYRKLKRAGERSGVPGGYGSPSRPYNKHSFSYGRGDDGTKAIPKPDFPSYLRNPRTGYTRRPTTLESYDMKDEVEDLKERIEVMEEGAGQTEPVEYPYEEIETIEDTESSDNETSEDLDKPELEVIEAADNEDSEERDSGDYREDLIEKFLEDPEDYAIDPEEFEHEEEQTELDESTWEQLIESIGDLDDWSEIWEPEEPEEIEPQEEILPEEPQRQNGEY